MDIIRGTLALFIFYLSMIEGYRILGVFPFAAKSHNIFLEVLMKGLAKRGHQVDVISHYDLKNPPENYKIILDLSKTRKQNVVEIPIEEVFGFQKNAASIIAKEFGNDLCDLMGLEEMQMIFKNSSKEQTYDLVVTEFFGATCYLGLGHFLKVPVVGALSFLEPTWVSNSIGNPPSSAFFPSGVMDVMEIKTFSDRLKNSLLKFLSATIFASQTENPQNEAMRKYLSPDMPSIREVEKSVALLITNTHYSFFGVRPTTPALIEVGGLHISEDEAEFTPELKQWMDESTSGVVYFTFGSTVLIESLHKDTILAIYSTFAKIAPVRVLMKIKDIGTLPPGLPENVKTLSWIPQIPVLSHNNTRVFITHCGLLGLQESLHFGVPIIGIPLHTDQFRNVQIFVMKKMGIRINYEDIREDVLDDALDRILNNATYREAAKYESRLFRDRPMTAMETATFWIEYILRNDDKTLKSPALELKWWHIQLLDVYAFLLSITLLVIYLIKIILKVVFRKLGLNKVGFQLMAFFSIRYKKPLMDEKLKDE